VWIVIGIVWVALNPNKQHAKKVHADRTGPTGESAETSVPVTAV
jgi:hypothetical protein